jgi:hypothetical protein
MQLADAYMDRWDERRPLLAGCKLRHGSDSEEGVRTARGVDEIKPFLKRPVQNPREGAVYFPG